MHEVSKTVDKLTDSLEMPTKMQQNEIENVSEILKSCHSNDHLKGKVQVETQNGAEKDRSIPTFVSFQAASGKGIAISHAAKEKAAGLLATWENDADMLTGSEPELTVSTLSDSEKHSKQGSFLTANVETGGTEEGIKLHAKAEKLVAENKREGAINIPKFVSFQSAGGKEIVISETSALKAQRLMEEIAQEKDSHLDVESNSSASDQKHENFGGKPFETPKQISPSKVNSIEPLMVKHCNILTLKEEQTDLNDHLDGLTSTQIAVLIETDDDMAWTQIPNQGDVKDNATGGESELRNQTCSNVADRPEGKISVIGSENNDSKRELSALISGIGNHESDSQWGPFELNESLIRLTDSHMKEQTEIKEEETSVLFDPELRPDMEAGDCNTTCLLNTSKNCHEFITASGYAIPVQEQSLGAARILLSELDDDRQCGEPILLSPPETGVSTREEAEEHTSA